MITAYLARAPIGLAPVVVFLAALLYLDSYKLLGLRTVARAMLVGGIAAGLSYFANDLLMDLLHVDFIRYARYGSPLIEEMLKALILMYMIRTNRIGLLVDAAIFGFAIGTGFAVVENLYYLAVRPDSHFAVWIVRGFGTAIMHGGASSIFAIVSLALADRKPDSWVSAFLPGLIAAATLHSAFNHFLVLPVLSTLGILVLLPPLIYFVFQRSEQILENWLGVDFDSDTELLAMINSGDFAQSHAGIYRHSLKDKFQGVVLADMLCYMRLHVELALRAKGVLLMRESGIELEIDNETREKFAELEYLERSIGKTGQLAMKPVLQISRKDLWQMNMLQR